MKKQETHALHHDKKKAMPCSGCTGPIPRHHALHLNRYGDPLPRHSINIREDYRTKGRDDLRGRKKDKRGGGAIFEKERNEPGGKFWRRRGRPKQKERSRNWGAKFLEKERRQ
jgi:hypothetical protein